jgi:hypothetical protein
MKVYQTTRQRGPAASRMTRTPLPGSARSVALQPKVSEIFSRAAARRFAGRQFGALLCLTTKKVHSFENRDSDFM